MVDKLNPLVNKFNSIKSKIDIKNQEISQIESKQRKTNEEHDQLKK